MESIVCFGVCVIDSKYQPWSKYCTFNDWFLREVLKFKPSVEIFSNKHTLLPNLSEEAIITYVLERKKCVELNKKINVDIIYYGTPLIGYKQVLALSDTVVTSLDSIKPISLQKHIKLAEQQVKAFKDFCTEYKVTKTGDPDWYLLSYYG